MSLPTDIKRFVHEYYRDWNSHNADRMAEKYTVDSVMEDPLLIIRAKGREGIRLYYQEMFCELLDPSYFALDYGWHDRRMYIRWEFAFRKGDERLRFRGVSMKEFDNGLIAADLAYWSPEHPVTG
jgi:nuclear transport factor 2 (NTF2) superfamily protein